MMSDEYAGLAIMMNLGHWAFAKAAEGVDFSAERDAIISELKERLRALISAMKGELPGIAVWICPEACVRVGQCGDCYRSGDPMFRVYYEKRSLDGEEVQRIRDGISNPVRRLLALSEAQQMDAVADIAQTRMIRIGRHGGMVGV